MRCATICATRGTTAPSDQADATDAFSHTSKHAAGMNAIPSGFVGRSGRASKWRVRRGLRPWALAVESRLVARGADPNNLCGLSAPCVATLHCALVAKWATGRTCKPLTSADDRSTGTENRDKGTNNGNKGRTCSRCPAWPRCKAPRPAPTDRTKPDCCEPSLSRCACSGGSHTPLPAQMVGAPFLGAVRILE